MAPAHSPTRVAFLVPEGAQILDVTGPAGAFAAANYVLARDFSRDQPAYEIETIGCTPGPVTVSGGIEIVANRAWGRARDDIHTLIVPGAPDLSPLLDERVLLWIRRMSESVERLVSVCTGAVVLAEAGLLKGKRATTHWESCPRLAAYDEVCVQGNDIFVRDGRIWTSAGITAGIDLTLALIEQDLGRAVAQATAQELVVFLRRPGGQNQFSAHLLAQSEEGDELDELHSWVLDNLCDDLSVATLADYVGVSPRHLSRLFRTRRNMTPAQFIEAARIDAARRLLDEPGLTLEQVARNTGFGSSERLRRACVRRLGVLPTELRRRNGAPAPRVTPGSAHHEGASK